MEESIKKVMGMYKYPFQLKDEQKKVVHHIVKGNSTLTVLPTGYGKTMTIILPPLLLNEVSCGAMYACLCYNVVEILLFDCYDFNTSHSYECILVIMLCFVFS